ncbi:MAG: response regulator, partial [Enterocloster clostridioformis]|nr:response regulator [Enterocloster clostridioformis]
IILRGLRSVIDWASLGIELVGTAGNGKEGLALLKEQRPELLMTDIRMPHVDGLQLIEEGKSRIRNSWPLCSAVMMILNMPEG